MLPLRNKKPTDGTFYPCHSLITVTMLHRRTLAVFTAFCLMTTAFFGLLPSGQRLVCQFTGEPMAAVVAPSPTDGAKDEATASCCTVSEKATATGAKRLVLTRPGCCELQQEAGRADLPAAVVNGAPLNEDAAVLASLPALPRPLLSAFLAAYSVDGEKTPRGPPREAANSRGPPFIS